MNHVYLAVRLSLYMRLAGDSASSSLPSSRLSTSSETINIYIKDRIRRADSPKAEP